MWAIKHQNGTITDGKERILHNLNHNWEFYLKNKKLYQDNLQMKKFVDELVSEGQDIHYISPDADECYLNQMSVSDEENFKDISYKAYFHYFVARQNKKKAEEFHIKIRDNSLERAEIWAEKRNEGKYLEECERIKEEYETRDWYMKKMDNLHWWELRENGKKFYKIYL
jgi:hypothetical protein